MQWEGSPEPPGPPPQSPLPPENWKTAIYTYDSAGRRICKMVDDWTVKYCYDGDHIIAEYDGEGRLLRKYIYGPRVDEPVCMINVADNNEVSYYHFDGLGSVIALSDEDGNTVQTYEYTVYGQVAAEDVNHPNPITFTGRWFDKETGLYYYRARYYNPEIGRFLQTDPVGYGMNLYAYCGNNPLNMIDPSGCDPCDPCDPCNPSGIWAYLLKYDPSNEVTDLWKLTLAWDFETMCMAFYMNPEYVWESYPDSGGPALYIYCSTDEYKFVPSGPGPFYWGYAELVGSVGSSNPSEGSGQGWKGWAGAAVITISLAEPSPAEEIVIGAATAIYYGAKAAILVFESRKAGRGTGVPIPGSERVDTDHPHGGMQPHRHWDEKHTDPKTGRTKKQPRVGPYPPAPGDPVVPPR